MSSSKKYDFSIEQGTSFRMSLTYKDTNNTIINLTNYCARLILTTNNNETKIFTTTNNDYSEYKFTIDGPNGVITLLLPASTTNNFNFKLAKYDLEIQSDDDLYIGGGKNTYRLLYGLISIVPRYSQNEQILNCSP
jgi:hypothetical protein